MDYKLKKIDAFIQDLINIVSELIKVELSIVDTDYYVIAGTQKYNHLIGKKCTPHIYQYVFKHKEILEIYNPKNNQVCLECDKKDKCGEICGITIPIKVDDVILGAMSISALNLEQKKVLVKYNKIYKNFGQKVVDLIESKFNSHYLTMELKYTNTKLDLIIDYIEKGVILTDSIGRIQFINDRCKKMFEIDLDNDDFNILDFINDKTISKLVMEKQSFEYLETTIDINNNRYNLILSGKPIEIEDNILGFLIILRDIKSMNRLLKYFADPNDGIGFEDIIGDSPEIRSAKNKALSVSENDSTIMIRGESGTGKELFARAIHNSSKRKSENLISINCGAIPENLIESELFGYDEGAFSGAKQSGKIGKFELADKGTIFLDEIGDMPLHLQIKILRAIESRKITRIGGNKEIDIDVRIIAATNKDLENKVKRNEFREDLYYRINVIPIDVPPLRKRNIEDVKLIFDFFKNKYAVEFNKNIKEVKDEYYKEIYNYNWPGNVRELKNVVEYSINLDNDGILTKDDLPIMMIENKYKNRIKTIEELKKNEIIKALKIYGNDTKGKEKTAKSLDIGTATLYRLIKKYKLS